MPTPVRNSWRKIPSLSRKCPLESHAPQRRGRTDSPGGPQRAREAVRTELRRRPAHLYKAMRIYSVRVRRICPDRGSEYWSAAKRRKVTEVSPQELFSSGEAAKYCVVYKESSDGHAQREMQNRLRMRRAKRKTKCQIYKSAPMNLIGVWSVAVPEAKNGRADEPSHVTRIIRSHLDVDSLQLFDYVWDRVR